MTLWANYEGSAIAAMAAELRKHRLDSSSQDSGKHCICRSDSRAVQNLNGISDLPWKDIDEHRAQVLWAKGI